MEVDGTSLVALKVPKKLHLKNSTAASLSRNDDLIPQNERLVVISLIYLGTIFFPYAD